jgi:YD repeat-containing protein
MGNRLLRSTNVPSWARNLTWDDYERRSPQQERLWKSIRSWEPADDPGLVLVGPPGLGKTMMASATLNEFQLSHAHVATNFSAQTRRVLKQQKYPVYFVQLAEVITLMIRLFQLQPEVQAGMRDPEEYLEIDQLVQDLHHTVQMLVIDDVGKEHRTGSRFAVDSFDYLVRTRHNRGLPTIFTSNLPIKMWSHTYSPSMENFVNRSSLIVKFA